jgi:hypothetical protein
MMGAVNINLIIHLGNVDSKLICDVHLQDSKLFLLGADTDEVLLYYIASNVERPYSIVHILHSVDIY